MPPDADSGAPDRNGNGKAVGLEMNADLQPLPMPMLMSMFGAFCPPPPTEGRPLNPNPRANPLAQFTKSNRPIPLANVPLTFAEALEEVDEEVAVENGADEEDEAEEMRSASSSCARFSAHRHSNGEHEHNEDAATAAADWSPAPAP